MSLLVTVLITIGASAAVAVVLVGPTLGPRRRNGARRERHDDAAAQERTSQRRSRKASP